MRKIGLLLLWIALLLVACGGGAPTGDAPPGDAPPGDPAARAVETYLSAKVSGDADAIRAGLCSEMESVLERELHTFDTVSGVEIENMACASDDPAAPSPRTVRCTGQIVALYGAEETIFPLAAYRAVEEDGEWRWCGETQ
jgi:hypothetical protein